MAQAFNRSSVRLSTTATTDVVTAPNLAVTDRALVLSLMIANISGSLANFTVEVTDSSNVVLTNLCYQLDIPAKVAIETIVNKLVLNNGEKIRVTASAANALDVTASVLELT